MRKLHLRIGAVVPICGLVVSSICSDRAVAAERLSVCALLADPVKYHGKLIAVRSPLVSTGEGAWLDGSNCKIKLVTNGFAWPMSVWLESGRQRYTETEFKQLLGDLERMKESFRRKNFDNAKDRLWITFTGIFTTHADLASRVSNGRTDGFGHMNSAPAELLVLREADPFIERHSSR